MSAKPPPDRPPAPASRSHWSDSLTFIIAATAMLLLVTALHWWQLAHSTAKLREETISQAQLRAAQVTSAASEVIALLFHSVDITSQELVSAYTQTRGRNFNARAALAIERLPAGSVLQVAVIGADGYLAYSNLGMGEKVFLGDREHFKVHLEGGPNADRFFISKPVLGRVSLQWSIQFSRAIMRDGQFMGVMVMSVAPAYLRNAMGKLTLDSDDSLDVFRQSGEFLASNRNQELSLGRTAEASSPYMQADAPALGTFTGTSAIDGVERILRWQRLPDYPITVVLGLSTSTVLKPAQRMHDEGRLEVILSTALMWVTTGIAALLARRVNAQVRRRQEIEHLAMHDTLTGLHSRHALLEHLNQAVERAAADGSRVGVLFLDLDGFKPVNDTHGHGVGDKVLQAIGGRLRGCVRDGDFPARIGGDEFVVVIDRLTDAEALARLGQRITQALDKPMAVDGTEIRIGASIGTAIYPVHGTTADALLVHADREMYVRKGQVRPR